MITTLPLNACKVSGFELIHSVSPVNSGAGPRSPRFRGGFGAGTPADFGFSAAVVGTLAGGTGVLVGWTSVGWRAAPEGGREVSPRSVVSRFFSSFWMD